MEVFNAKVGKKQEGEQSATMPPTAGITEEKYRRVLPKEITACSEHFFTNAKKWEVDTEKP